MTEFKQSRPKPSLEQEVEKVEQEVEEEEEPGMVWRLALLIVNDVEVTEGQHQ